MATNNAVNKLGEAPIGSIARYDFAAPANSGWLKCDGATLDTTAYAQLFAIVGYTYGGSGSDFDLPTIADKLIRAK
jgi:microcystin-dependent protein